LNFKGEVMCQVEKTGILTCQVAQKKNRKLQFILDLIVKVHHHKKKLFKMALSMPKNFPDMHVLAAAKMQLYT